MAQPYELLNQRAQRKTEADNRCLHVKLWVIEAQAVERWSGSRSNVGAGVFGPWIFLFTHGGGEASALHGNSGSA